MPASNTVPAGSGGPDEPGRVPLGLEAAWGFSPLDRTSPARAAAAQALVDVALTGQPVTELRIHGVSGSNGPAMLEHPDALQVGGDKVAGFFRRWSPAGGPGRPSVRWKLEAYSWGGLTEPPLASASWLLLAPFMMYNVAYFMLPPRHIRHAAVAAPQTAAGAFRRGAGHWAAQALLRLLAVAATVQFVVGVTTVMISTAAWQAGRKRLLPDWMAWYADRPTGVRMAIALVAVAVVIAVLWWISVTTATKYERRTTAARPEPGSSWPLTAPGFWHGDQLVRRQRSLHVAAGGAAAALIVALPAERLAAARTVAIILAAAILAAAGILLTSPMADRHALVRARGQAGNQEDRAGRTRAGRPDLSPGRGRSWRGHRAQRPGGRLR